MPFMLAYVSEAVLPIEVGLHTHHLTKFQEELNNATLREALDLLPSVQGNALLRERLYKLRITRLHDRTVKLQPINVGDFVLCHIEVVARAGEHDKLTIIWEGPYKVTAQIRPGTYHLETSSRMPISRTWHNNNLRKYYYWHLSLIQAQHLCTYVFHAIKIMVAKAVSDTPHHLILFLKHDLMADRYTFSSNGG